MLIKYSVLLIYFGILFVIGILASKKIKGLEDFYVGGKNLGYWVVAFSARATGESGWLLLGLTGMGALMGFKALWVVLGEVLGVSICWLFMAKKFKILTDKYKSITIPDYLVSHFGATTNTLRAISAFILAAFVTIYVSAQIDATGSAFETFFNLNYYVGAIVGFVIVVFYIFTGGFVAVAWSDLFQGLMMFFGLVFLPIVAFFSFEKFGITDSFTVSLQKIDPNLLSVWGEGGLSLMNVLGIVGFLMIGIGFLGSPQIFVRFISIKDLDEIKKGTVVAIVFTLLTDVCAVFAGMFGRILLTNHSQVATDVLGNGAQNVLPMLVDKIFPPVIIAIYIAAVLSAIMSTIDSLLIVASSAITRDYYQQIFKPDLKEENLASLSRKVTLILALCSLALAMAVAVLSPTRTIFWFVIFGWSGIAASFCPTMILSLFWKGFNEKGAIASMISGFLSVPLFKFVVPKTPVAGKYFEQLSELPPSFFVAIMIGIIVSKLTKNNQPKTA